ncbi:hypothetical protein QNH48_14995 [Neobacillus sp. YX16]|uniref:hypothetical protein n=1 Tax=Neobacillus sp. YX16 TaxID=3047874 RepID=UPI0024C307C9|nr:hypothetical protein [Neobacillus sp. YX16]WHZ05846.1 hypothetical protein QNH48_14995 [Neobacillus sp. YX16]
MYKMQLCNVYTQEILREEDFDTPDVINNLIHSAKKSDLDGLDAFIIDSKKRTLKADYVTHSIVTEANTKVYKIFFKTSIAKKQAIISSK